jgi:hypothetical protein
MIGLPIGGTIALLLFASAMMGMLVARFLPHGHLSAETKNVVSVSTAVVGTLSALVVGLLISSANTSFAAKANEVGQISGDLIRLDRLLRRYAPETQGIRMQLHRYGAATLQDLFPPDNRRTTAVESDATMNILESVETDILALTPATDTQRWLKEQALDMTTALASTRWQLVQEEANRTPVQLVILMLFWFVIIFMSFGLFSPRNATAAVAILLCAVGVGSAIRMETEFQDPFHGVIRIPSAPLAHALDVIGS